MDGDRTFHLDRMHVDGAGNGVQRTKPFAVVRRFTYRAACQPASQPRCGNHRLESRVRENRTHGSEGGDGGSRLRPLSKKRRQQCLLWELACKRTNPQDLPESATMIRSVGRFLQSRQQNSGGMHLQAHLSTLESVNDGSQYAYSEKIGSTDSCQALW